MPAPMRHSISQGLHPTRGKWQGGGEHLPRDTVLLDSNGLGRRRRPLPRARAEATGAPTARSGKAEGGGGRRAEGEGAREGGGPQGRVGPPPRVHAPAPPCASSHRWAGQPALALLAGLGS
ncbi:unnamed protein product [Prorocentrum cordatum]|uniref:Uncharacterized protein n=1 Tax=Prorocentrum cordatum TaxID=2364126 RepID=A0ABN9WNP8_9DINO|nr:unnamed protein product [Polarella glacialis]CAK0888259.1 unnamed protein product [Polarella glacialis]